MRESEADAEGVFAMIGASTNERSVSAAVGVLCQGGYHVWATSNNSDPPRGAFCSCRLRRYGLQFHSWAVSEKGCICDGCGLKYGDELDDFCRGNG